MNGRTLRALGAIAPLSGALVVSCAAGEVGAGAGESCQTRSDCALAFVCIDNACALPGSPRPDQGGAGESCRARSDCAVGLSCVANVCVSIDSGADPTGKSCYPIECSIQDDCCQDFVPSPNCPQYEADCNADPAYCLTYRLLCECNRGCEEEICVDTPPGCEANAECTSFLEPFCVDGHCRECSQHGDCPDETDRCIDGVCQAPCTLDEHCPLLYACQAGECVEVGCSTDLECYFLLGDHLATCGSDGQCLVPCVTTLECAEFHVCHQGSCVFVGCNTDEECRIYLGLEEESGDVQAVCK
jgi:hypothetical protein